MSEEFMSFIPADQNIVPDVEENNALENDTLESEQLQEETTEIDSSETDKLENNEVDNDEIEIDQSQINPLLYFDTPITRPNKAAQRELNEVSERALTGRRPSMREPRKPKPVNRNDYGQDATDYNEPQLNYEPEDKEYQRKKQFEIEETKRQVENYFGRSEKKEPEIQITGLELKEDIQITLDQNAIKSLIILGLNQRYKKEGLRVNPEIDEEVEFQVDKVNEKQKSYSGCSIKANVTMQRIPIVRFVEE